jgi:hypothetical protein
MRKVYPDMKRNRTTMNSEPAQIHECGGRACLCNANSGRVPVLLATGQLHDGFDDRHDCFANVLGHICDIYERQSAPSQWTSRTKSKTDKQNEKAVVPSRQSQRVPASILTATSFISASSNWSAKNDKILATQ